MARKDTPDATATDAAAPLTPVSDPQDDHDFALVKSRVLAGLEDTGHAKLRDLVTAANSADEIREAIWSFGCPPECTTSHRAHVDDPLPHDVAAEAPGEEV